MEVSMFKVGDKTLTIDPWFGNDLLAIVEFRKNGNTDYAIFSDGGFFRTSALRLATTKEIAAGHRIDLETLRDCDASPNCKIARNMKGEVMRSEFEIIARRNGWNLTTYPDFTGRTDYVNTLTEQAWTMFKYQQSKVDELQKRMDDSIFILSTIDTPDEAYKLIDLLLKTLKGDTKKLEQALKGGGE